ncbi:MAG: hypothetical protein LBQ34_04235, partial [Alphaproteobacteria bacterium]|nr:hypothetical protein [Alphaproteobacteria bacterium]
MARFSIIFLVLFAMAGMLKAEEGVLEGATASSVENPIKEIPNYKGHYVRFGNSIAKAQGAYGNISNFDFSIFSYKEFILGVSLENGMYSYHGGHYGKINQVSSFAQ